MDSDNILRGVKIVVIGVGGAGNNAVNKMIDKNISNVEFYAMNTDAQSLFSSKVDKKNKIVLGQEITKGLGAGGDPEIGKRAAEASEATIRAIVKDANMVFIAAGMGGGTGSGAAPVIASICRDEGALTVAIVTRPFGFEGVKKKSVAMNAIKNLINFVDSYIVVSNDKLLMSAGSESLDKAFDESDKVLYLSIKTIVDLIMIPGKINLDFSDIRNTLKDSGLTLIGFGEGRGQNRVDEAVNKAITPQLLETDINGAKKAICSVTGCKDVTLFEAQECVSRVIECTEKCQDVKLGLNVDESLEDCVRVSVIASGFNDDEELAEITLDGSLVVEEESQKTSKENEVHNKLTDQDKKKTEEKEVETEEDILPNYLKNR